MNQDLDSQSLNPDLPAWYSVISAYLWSWFQSSLCKIASSATAGLHDRNWPFLQLTILQIPNLNNFIDYAKGFECVDHNKLWKILQVMGIPGHLTCFLRNLYAGKEATVRTRHGTTDWFQIGKGVHQCYIVSPCLFNLYAEYIMRNAGLDEAQTGIKIVRRNTNNLRYAWHHPYGRKQRGTKEPLDESEGGWWKSWLETQHSEN